MNQTWVSCKCGHTERVHSSIFGHICLVVECSCIEFVTGDGKAYAIQHPPRIEVKLEEA